MTVPVSTDAAPFVVSGPVPGAQSAAATAGVARVAATVAYISLPPGSFPSGVSASITVERTRALVETPLVDGGFDPLAIAANAGDTLLIAVQTSASLDPIAARVVVPVAQPPIIVRTEPPKHKRDVPLNAHVVVVFSSPVDPTTVTNESVSLQRGGTAVAGTLSFLDAARTTVQFTPAALLVGGTDYAIVVTPSIRGVDGAMLPATSTTSRLLTLYTSADGSTVVAQTTGTFRRPAGTFKVLVVMLRYSQTIGSNAAQLWAAAQASINADHAAFAASRGFAAPIVQFDNTNVIVDASTVADPRSLAGISAALAQQGQSVAGYDFVVSVNIDPSRTEGGFSFVPFVPSPPGFIYMGNDGAYRSTLSAANYRAIAGAVYDHEVYHHWGWPGTHDWVCGVNNANFEFNFRVPPVIFGWEDLDGDGVPEILQAAPYGWRPQ